MSGDHYSGSGSFAIDDFWAESDEEAQLAISGLRDEFVEWVRQKKSVLAIYAVEVNLDPQNIETP